VGTAEPVPFAPGVGLLGLNDLPIPRPGQVEPIANLLRGVRIVSAGVPRRDSARREPVLSSVRVKGVRWWLTGGDRVVQLARAVVTMWDRDREHYEELKQILIDLGVVHEVAVKVYKDPTADGEAGKQQDFAAVLFDGVNLGFQSDGTLRVAEIIVKLLQPDVSCLLVEEPETAVHPGLLAKLLALFDAYSLDRQIVVSTHSPEVVNWCSPQDVRLVVRENGVTRAHPLESGDLESVMRHLQDDGTLADFVYRRQRT
jgi:AAA domain, putative AbiEii toxin, Type IV TA system